MANAPRTFIYGNGKPGGWFNVEDFFNELTVYILNSNTVKALAIGITDLAGNQVAPYAIGTSVSDGRTVVTTAGTRVQLSTSSVASLTITITAETSNTGIVVVGGSAVVAAVGTRRGVPLFAGDSYTIAANNLNLIYLDSTVNGEGVTYTYTA